MVGGAGNDSLYGFLGSDTLSGGAGNQKILGLAVSGSTASNAVLDITVNAQHDTLTLASASGVNYTYYNAAGTTVPLGNVNLAGLTASGADIYVYDQTHTTLLADLHYHT